VRTPEELAAYAEGDRRHVVDNCISTPNPLDLPPQSSGQVLVWMEECGVTPSKDAWKSARSVHAETPLRDVLLSLGCTDSQMRSAAAQ
jgi:hypothetical protein